MQRPDARPVSRGVASDRLPDQRPRRRGDWCSPPHAHPLRHRASPGSGRSCAALSQRSSGGRDARSFTVHRSRSRTGATNGSATTRPPTAGTTWTAPARVVAPDVARNVVYEGGQQLLEGRA
jgi:hypothetical protein